VAREENTSAVNNLQKKVFPEELVTTPAKLMIKELEKMSSTSCNSVFRDIDKAIRDFTWETVWHELTVRAPIVLHFFKLLFHKAPKSVICFVISMILKWRCPQMGLVQRVVSTLMY